MRAADVMQRGRADVAPLAVGAAAGKVEERPYWQGKKFWTKNPAEHCGLWVDGICRCNAWILFGSLATAEERARPTCSVFPFALRGAA